MVYARLSVTRQRRSFVYGMTSANGGPV